MNSNNRELLRGGAAELGVQLNERQLDQFSQLAEELLRWNQKVNLTALRNEGEVVAKHFLDSLTLVPHVPKQGQILDIGSGGGFPGLPLSIVLQEIKLVSVDAVEKKILFQRHACRLLQLTHVSPLHLRGEDLVGDYASFFDCAVSRAFSDLGTFARIVAPLLAIGGKAIAMKGSRGEQEAENSETEVEDFGLQLDKVLKFHLPLVADERTLVVFEKK